MAKSFLDVASEMRRRIQSGEYPSGRPLPSERVLGEEFLVHRATLRRALAALERDGLVVRAPGDRPYPKAPAPSLMGSIALCATDPDDPFARSLVATGIVQELRRHGTALRLVWSDDHAFRPDEPFSEELLSHVGLVLWPPALTDVDRLRSLQERMPTVLVDARVPGFETDFVGFEDTDAGYRATRHLYEQGHRRIAFVGSLGVETSRFRQLGYVHFLREHSLEPIEGYEALGLVHHLPPKVVDGYLDASDPNRPTAFLCENDETAARLIPYLEERGLRVPENISLMGFGGAQPVLLDALGLTTMVQPYLELGRQAARLLLRRLEGEREAEAATVRLPMTVRARSSSRGSATSAPA